MLASSGITQKSADRAGTTARLEKWWKGLGVGRSRARADPLHCEVMPGPRNWDSPDAATAAPTEADRSRWVRQPFYLLGRRSETHSEMLLQVHQVFNGDVFATELSYSNAKTTTKRD